MNISLIGVGFLYVIALIFACVVGYQIVVGVSPNDIAVSFVTLIVGYTIHNVGVTKGVNVVSDTVASQDTKVV